jgi:hypothetical protein
MVFKLGSVSEVVARRWAADGNRGQGATTSRIDRNTARRSDAVPRFPDASNAREEF